MLKLMIRRWRKLHFVNRGTTVVGEFELGLGDGKHLDLAMRGIKVLVSHKTGDAFLGFPEVARTRGGQPVVENGKPVYDAVVLPTSAESRTQITAAVISAKPIADAIAEVQTAVREAREGLDLTFGQDAPSVAVGAEDEFPFSG